MCPYSVFNITPMKWGHTRLRLMKHIWGSRFALFPPSKWSSSSGPHGGYEKNLTSAGSASKVQSNIIWCLTPITTRKRKCLELVCLVLQAKAVETLQEGAGLSLHCSNCCFYMDWHILQHKHSFTLALNQISLQSKLLKASPEDFPLKETHLMLHLNVHNITTERIHLLRANTISHPTLH